MKLVVDTTTYVGNNTVRFETEAHLDQVLAILGEMRIYGWELYDKGGCCLQRDDGNLYVSIRPASSKNDQEFLRQVEINLAYLCKTTVPQEILAKAAEVIGDPKMGWQWLSTPNPMLGARPLDLLEHPDGAQRVLDELGRMEWGAFS